MTPAGEDLYAVLAVRGIDLDIADHEFVVLVGPSAGSPTTLRMIADSRRSPTARSRLTATSSTRAAE